MKKNLEAITQNFTAVSVRISLCIIGFFFFSWAIPGVTMQLELNLKWIGIFAETLFVLGALMLAISWITPILLIILGAPKLAHAWLRGINPFGFSSKRWEQLSNDEKFPTYQSAIGLFLVTLVAMVGVILHFIQKK